LGEGIKVHVGSSLGLQRKYGHMHSRVVSEGTCSVKSP
jgi:hypothetical protein